MAAFLCSAGAIPPSRPMQPPRRRAQELSRNGRFLSGHPQGLFLTAASTAALSSPLGQSSREPLRRCFASLPALNFELYLLKV